MNTKIGVQQYMVREYVKTEEKARFILGKLKEIGYSSIELCGFLVEPNPMLKGTELELKEKLDWSAFLSDSGISACSLHEIIEDIAAKPEEIINRAKEFNVDTVVAAGSFATDYTKIDSVKALVEDLNKSGRVLKDAGLNLLYHNHNAEVAKMKDAEGLSLDVIYNEIDPEYVGVQLDLFWLQNGGFNPDIWIDKAANKIKSLHLNDAGPSEGGPSEMIRTLVGKELGTGNMDLKAMISKALGYGCKSLILETHDNWIGGDVVESMRISYDFLKAII